MFVCLRPERWSVYLCSKALNHCRQHSIDVLHCVWLGISKTVWLTWRKSGLVTDKDLKVIEERMRSLRVPDGVSNFVSKLRANFSYAKAADWKAWTCIFSLYCLRDILPAEHYQCWELFVSGCCLLVQYSLTTDDIDRIESLFLAFFKEYSRLWADEWWHVKSNFHLLLHIHEDLRRYGSMYNFHTGPFERMNNVFSNKSHNNKRMELQWIKSWHAENKLARDLGGMFLDGDKSLIDNLRATASSLRRGKMKDSRARTFPARMFVPCHCPKSSTPQLSFDQKARNGMKHSMQLEQLADER